MNSDSAASSRRAFRRVRAAAANRRSRIDIPAIEFRLIS